LADRALNFCAARTGLLRWAGGLKRCGQRREWQLVAMHGRYPQELELREEKDCHRDSP